jgi:mannose-6-phosphate isomerase
MQNTKKIFRLNGKVQHYSWGGFEFIPSLLNTPNDSKQPFAEYWLGAHEKAPSEIVGPEGKKEPLDKFIAADSINILGAKVNSQFGRLPFLLKVLDVKDMLSIQVHPSKKSAEKEFADENKKGIAIDSASRNYKDDNHKPELMFALSDFWLLHGFKEKNKMISKIEEIKELAFLKEVFEKSGYEGLYRRVMEMPQQEVNESLQPLLDRIIPLYRKGKLEKKDENFWAARAAITFNEPGKTDRGIFSIYLFNLLNLKPGEAIFQDAGIPHAYLEGQNMEIMANSDNVLRGGLTNKHIDVPELMKHVKPEPVIPNVLKGTSSNHQYEEVFTTPTADFELRKIALRTAEQTTILSHTAEIFFVLEGKTAISGDAGQMIMSKGEAFLATSGSQVDLTAIGSSVIFRATVPV